MPVEKPTGKTLAQRPRGFEHRDSRPGETFPACLAKSGQVSMVITLNKVYMDCLGAVRITYPSRRSSADPTLEKRKVSYAEGLYDDVQNTDTIAETIRSRSGLNSSTDITRIPQLSK